MLAAQTPEALVEEREQPQRRHGHDRGGPATGQEQADLAAELTRPERRDEVALLLDLSRSLEDREELVREVALADDSLTGREGDLVERGGQSGSRGRRKRREDGNRIDECLFDHGWTLLRCTDCALARLPRCNRMFTSRPQWRTRGLAERAAEGRRAQAERTLAAPAPALARALLLGPLPQERLLARALLEFAHPWGLCGPVRTVWSPCHVELQARPLTTRRRGP